MKLNEKTRASLEKTLLAIENSALIKTALVVCVVAPFVYLLLPVVLNKSAEALIRNDELIKADIVMAFAGDALNNRERHAVELYRQGWAKKLVISGAQVAWGINTADLAKRFVLGMGVPESDILMVRETRNTRTEAQELEKLMRANNFRSAIVVTSAFHSRRATYTAESAAKDFEFISSPVAPGAPEWHPSRWWSRRKDMITTIREFFSWVNTLAGAWQ
jgi:uncharacterized SAM-binding protein YcdF (DUF218 family)